MFTRTPSANSLKCDAIVTDQPNLTLVVKTADCVPILLSDPVNHIIGVVHAGWKGLNSGVIQNAIAKMIDIGSQSKYINVAIGPCILRENYEVQEDFLEAFGSTGKEFSRLKQGKYYFDLLGCCQDILKKEGIREIHTSEVDTYTNTGISSYRRTRHLNNPDTYRNISAIVINRDNDKHQMTNDDKHPDEWGDFIQKVNKVRNRRACLPQDIQKMRHPVSVIIDGYEKPYSNHKDSDIEVKKRRVQLSNHESCEIIRKIRRSKIRLERTLDLHWETEESAYKKTIGFILESYEAGLRYLLIIVGKGKNGKGKLRDSLASWVENHCKTRELLMLVEEALPQHGGEGAYYVFLRRKR